MRLRSIPGVSSRNGAAAARRSRRRLDYDDIGAEFGEDPSRQHRLRRGDFQHANVIEHSAAPLTVAARCVMLIIGPNIHTCGQLCKIDAAENLVAIVSRACPTACRSARTLLAETRRQSAAERRQVPRCGYVFFPPQRYGCESCGAPPEKLEAGIARTGTLHSYATVHLHQGKDIEAPFTVGLIVLDDGPAVRSTLTDRTDEGLAIGDRMKSVLVAAGTDQDGNRDGRAALRED